MRLTNQKRLAADILNVGQTRIWIDPTRLDDVEEFDRWYGLVPKRQGYI